jgi:hypothetical protein
MDLTLSLISQGISALIELWKNHANKAANWVPSEQEIADLLALSDKTSEQYKQEAAARLGKQWPPAPPTT